MSRFKSDSNAEKELATFLDENFYNVAMKEGLIESFRRVYDYNEQLNGIDLIITMHDGIKKVDEKATLYYINQNIPTFAFELLYTKNSTQHIGWFIDEKKTTDLYCLIWPFSNKTFDVEKIKNIKKNDFSSVKIMFINPHKLRNYLNECGWPSTKLLEKAQAINLSGESGKLRIEGINDFYFYKSPASKYTESPVNLVIRVERLRKIAEKKYSISKNIFSIER